MDRGDRQAHQAKSENLVYPVQLVQEDLQAPVDPWVWQAVREKLDFLVKLANLVQEVL